MRIGITNKDDFLALLVRRKWWIVVPFLALSGMAALLIYHLPSTYVSQTLILVRQRDIPENFVVDLTAGSSQQRLTAIEQTVLSRTNMVQILSEFAGRLPDFETLNLDQRVARLTSQIDVNFQTQPGRTGPEVVSFTIQYQNQDPDLAQLIADKLTTLFIEQDNQVREDQVYGTTEFFTRELDKAALELADVEEELEAIQRRNQLVLPEQRDANLRTLERLAIQQQTNADQLDRIRTDRMTLERQISETAETLPVEDLIAAAPPPNPLVEDYRQALSDYEDLARRYTSEHPSLDAARRRLEALEAQLPEGVDLEAVIEPPIPEEPTPNPVYLRLRDQLDEVMTELEIQERERGRIEALIAEYSSRVELTPAAEAEMAEVLRRHTALRAVYDDLSGKLSESELSQSLESGQKGSQFVIVDPANRPLEPARPNKMATLMGAIGASLAFALAFAAAIDILRQRVWTQGEIETFWGVPVLVDIPEILTDVDVEKQRKKRLAVAASSVGGVGVYAALLYVVYLGHDSILGRLDPLLQRLVY